MERAKDRDDVIRRRLVFVRVVVARTALDAVLKPELRDIALRFRADRRQVDRHACHPRIRLAHQNRIRPRTAGEIEDSGFGVRDSGFGVRDSGFGVRGSGFVFARSKAEHRHDPLPDSHRTTEHRRGKRLRPHRIFAQMDLRLLHRLARFRKLGEFAPRRVHVAVVADRLREIRGASRHERRLSRRRIAIGLAVLLQKPFRNAGIRKQPQSTAFNLLALLDPREKVDVNRGEQHRAAVIRTRQIDDFLHALHLKTSTIRAVHLPQCRQLFASRQLRTFGQMSDLPKLSLSKLFGKECAGSIRSARFP